VFAIAITLLIIAIAIPATTEAGERGRWGAQPD